MNGNHESSIPDSTDGSGITADVFCVQCSYNLRGLTKAGRCPECGESVARSLRGPKLSEANARWLTRIHGGILLVNLGLWIGTVTCIAILLTSTTRFAGSQLMITVPWLVVAGGFAVAVSFVLLGCMFCSSVEPRTARETKRWDARRWIRAASITVICLGCLAAMNLLERFTAGNQAITSIFPWDAILLMGQVAAIALCICGLSFLVELADRLPNEGFVLRTRKLRHEAGWLSGLWIAWLIVDFCVGQFSSPGRYSRLKQSAEPFYLLILLWLVWVAIRLIRLLGAYRHKVGAALTSSRLLEAGDRRGSA